MKRILILAVLLLLIINSIFAQSNSVYFPKIGEVIRDHTFTDVINNDKKVISIKDCRGQWLVLDVWSRFCAGCINTFPRMNALSKEFKGKAKLIMVAAAGLENDPNDMPLTKKLFNKQAKINNLNFTVAFDSTARSLFDFYATPFIVVIDPTGKVVVKTDHLESEDLNSIMNGKVPQSIKIAYSAHEILPDASYDKKSPLYTSGKYANGGLDTAFAYRSLLSKWNDKMPFMIPKGFFTNNNVSSKTSECWGYDLQHLLYFVYTGRLEWYPKHNLYDGLILDTKQFTLKDFQGGEYIDKRYSYSITLPENQRTLKNIEKFLSEDLERAFGITSVIEMRPVKGLMLVVKDIKKLNKLKSKGGKRTVERTGYGEIYGIRNMTLQHFLEIILRAKLNVAQMGKREEQTLIEDQTNFAAPLDFDIELDYLKFDQIVQKLHEMGLDLIETKKIMKCIVVSDSR